MDDTKLSDKNIFNILSSLPKLVELNLDNNFLTGIPVIQVSFGSKLKTIKKFSFNLNLILTLIFINKINSIKLSY